MVPYRKYAVVVFGPNRRNYLTFAGVGILIGLAYWLMPAMDVPAATVAGVQYAVALALFCIWMAWFVFAGVAVWRAGGFGED